MRLSQADIELIGKSILRDYVRRTTGTIRLPIDITCFAQHYLGVRIQHRRLSDKGNILGLTTYKRVNLKLAFADKNVLLSVPENTILIEERLLHPHNRKRWRFTIAHECAHQILARISDKEVGGGFRKSFATGTPCSYRELKTPEDWSEWQADSLGAVLLMPKMEVLNQLHSGHKPFALTKYGDHFNSWDYTKLKRMADTFYVSLKAMELRIKKLGYLALKPKSACSEPLEIFDDS